MIKLRDAESGKELWVDTSSRNTRGAYAHWWQEQSKQLDYAFTRSGVDYVNINTREDYVRSLMTLFKKRGSRL